MPSHIVYAGGFPLPDFRASALRAIDNAKLFRDAGLTPVVTGRFAAGHDGRRAVSAGGEAMVVDGIACRNIELPDEPRAYLRSAEPVWRVIDDIGVQKVMAVVAYNYPARALADLLRLSGRLKIPIVAECTEWTGIEGRNVVRNVVRQAGAGYRMAVLAKRAGHVICATRHAAKHFRPQNVLVLPWVLHAKSAARPARQDDTLRFVYAGTPGARFSKERIDRVVEALARLANHPRPFVLELTLSREAFLAAAPHLAPAVERLRSKIVFHGWLGRTPMEALLLKSDISVFARPNRRSNRFGFPTKLAEAYRFGLPVLANATGDVGAYIRDGRTGWIANGADVDSLEIALRRALETPQTALLNMKRHVRADNPFAPALYRDQLSAFLANVGAARSAMRAAA